MRKMLILPGVLFPILMATAAGCTVDLAVNRPGEQLQLHVKPQSSRADAPGEKISSPTAETAGDLAK